MAVFAKNGVENSTRFFTGQRCQTRRPLNRASSTNLIGPPTPRLPNPASFFTASVVGNGAEETEAAPKRESKKITSVKPMATAEPFGRYVVLGAATKEAVLPVPAATGSAFSINGTGGIFVVLVAWFSTVEAYRKPDNIGGSLK